MCCVVLWFCELGKYRIFKTLIGQVLSSFSPPSPTLHFPSVRGLGAAAGISGTWLRGEVGYGAMLKCFKVTSKCRCLIVSLAVPCGNGLPLSPVWAPRPCETPQKCRSEVIWWYVGISRSSVMYVEKKEGSVQGLPQRQRASSADTLLGQPAWSDWGRRRWVADTGPLTGRIGSWRSQMRACFAIPLIPWPNSASSLSLSLINLS